MLRLRPYKQEDAEEILSWTKDAHSFYQWSAGIMGDYPITKEAFGFVDRLTAFTAFDENGIVGFFTLRNPGETFEEVRFGFVIIAPEYRGMGKGKEMLHLGLTYAFEVYRADRASLSVFENNLPAYYCYKSVGFKDAEGDNIETYPIGNETWRCRKLVLDKNSMRPLQEADCESGRHSI